jgi:hypothetical protein
MGLLRVIGLILFSIFLLVSIIFFSLLNAAQQFLDENFYASVFEKTNFYSDLKAFFISQVLASYKIEMISTDKLRESLMKNIPDDFFKDEVNRLLKSILTYAKGETNQLNLTISFNKVKRNISDSIAEAVGNENFVEIVRSEIEKKNLEFNLDERGEIKNFLSANRKYVNYLNTAYLFSIVFVLVFGVVVFVLSRGKGKIRNISIILLIAGIFLILISSFLSSLTKGKLGRVEIDTGGRIILMLVEGFLARINLLSYLFIFSSVAGIIISFFK